MRWIGSPTTRGTAYAPRILDADDDRPVGPRARQHAARPHRSSTHALDIAADMPAIPGEVRPLVGCCSPTIPRPPSIRDGLCFLDHLRGCYRPRPGLTTCIRRGRRHPSISPIPTASSVRMPMSPSRPVRASSTNSNSASSSAAGPELRPVNGAEGHVVGYVFPATGRRPSDAAISRKASASGLAARTARSPSAPGWSPPTTSRSQRRDGHLAIDLSPPSTDANSPAATHRRDGLEHRRTPRLCLPRRRPDPGSVIRLRTIPAACSRSTSTPPDPRRMPRWFRPGDVVTLRGDGLGETRNTVVAGVDVIPCTLASDGRAGCPSVRGRRRDNRATTRPTAPRPTRGEPLTEPTTLRSSEADPDGQPSTGSAPLTRRGNPGDVLAYAQQKRMKLREEVTFYSDDSKTRVLFGSNRARSSTWRRR